MRPLFFIAIPFLASCGKPKSEPWPWPIDGVAEVRCFFINPEDRYGIAPLVGKDGSLNPSRRPVEGLVLTEEQELAVRESVLRERPPYSKAMCFYPHHSFLLLDKSGNRLGSIDLCFQCNQHTGIKGLAKYVDLSVLAYTIEQLGFPIDVEDPNAGDPFGPEGVAPGALDVIDPFADPPASGEPGAAGQPATRPESK